MAKSRVWVVTLVLHLSQFQPAGQWGVWQKRRGRHAGTYQVEPASRKEAIARARVLSLMEIGSADVDRVEVVEAKRYRTLHGRRS